MFSPNSEHRNAKGNRSDILNFLLQDRRTKHLAGRSWINMKCWSRSVKEHLLCFVGQAQAGEEVRPPHCFHFFFLPPSVIQFRHWESELVQVCVEKDPACTSDRPHSPVCPPGGRQLLLCTDQLVPSYDSHKSFVYQEWLVKVNSSCRMISICQGLVSHKLGCS